MIGRLTRWATAGLLVTSLSFGGVARLHADDSGDRLREWSSLPAGSSGLVFIIDAQVASFSLADGQKKLLSKWSWSPSLPFVRQYRLPPGRYDIALPPPLTSVGVETKEGTLTYVQLRTLSATSFGQERVSAVDVTASWGPVPEFVGQWLEKAYANGRPDIYKTETLHGVSGNVLLASTEPPWQIPPPPPPPPRK